MVDASEFCEELATQLMAISAASVTSPGIVLRAVDNRNVQLLDSLIEHEQKEVRFSFVSCFITKIKCKM